MLRCRFTVEYVPGKKLVVADALSRAPILATEIQDEMMKLELLHEHIFVITALFPASDAQLQRIREETKNDLQLGTLLQILQSAWPAAKSQLDINVRPFWDSRHLFTQVDGLILRGPQMVIPRSLRGEMLERAHEGHLGIVKTKAPVREVFGWPEVNNQIEQLVSSCETCARFQNQQHKEPLLSIDLPQRPWEKIALDLFEFEGDNYILFMDYYLRFPEIRRLSSTRSAKVVSTMTEIFACHGIPTEIVSDNEPQFYVAEFQQFAAQFSFRHTTSSLRYPQGNGLVERCV